MKFWIFVPSRYKRELLWCRPSEFVVYYFGQDYEVSFTVDSRGCIWYWVRTENQYRNVAALVWEGDDPQPLPSKTEKDFGPLILQVARVVPAPPERVTILYRRPPLLVYPWLTWPIRSEAWADADAIGGYRKHHRYGAWAWAYEPALKQMNYYRALARRVTRHGAARYWEDFGDKALDAQCCNCGKIERAEIHPCAFTCISQGSDATTR